MAALLLSGATARAAQPVFEHRFTTEQPGASSGMTSHIVYPDYDGKPKPMARLLLELPEGSRFDESAVPTCTATDNELVAQGTGACPAGTEVGGGSGSVVTGFGSPFDPISGDLHVFHGPHQIVNVGTPPGSDRVLVVSRGKIDGARLDYDVAAGTPPTTPGGPPDGRTTAKEITLRIDARSRAGRDFLTTPDLCPGGGSWTFRLAVTYEDGTTDTATSASPCWAQPPAAARPPRPALRLLVRPRRARAGHRVRLRFQLSSPARSCLRGAVIRFGRARLRPDRRGRAALVTRLRRPGRHRARATKPGCRPATAAVIVRR